MRRLVYLDNALDDFTDVLRHLAIESGSLEVATRFTGQLQAQCSRLAALPGTLGTARPELRPDLRSYAFKGYVILFRYVGDTFEVVNLIEGHRDLDGMFV